MSDNLLEEILWIQSNLMNSKDLKNIQSLVKKYKPHWWSGVINSQLARLEYSRLWVLEPRWGQAKEVKIAICTFSTKLAALKSKSKDWLTRIQENVFKLSDMFINRLFFE